MNKVIKLPPADAYNFPFRGYASKSNNLYKELKINPVQWSNLRKKLLRKQNFKCAYCLTDLKGKRMNVEHVIPVRRGGTNTSANIVASCWQCNKQKGSSPLSKKRKTLLEENLKKLAKQSRKSAKVFKAGLVSEEDYQEQLGNDLRRMFTE